MTKPQRFISALVMKYLDAGHSIKHLKIDNQFNTPDTFAPPYEHEFIGKVERMNRTVQDKVTCALKISIIKSRKIWLFALLDVLMKLNVRHLQW